MRNLVHRWHYAVTKCIKDTRFSWRRRGLQNTQFTIIADNCWAGAVYRYLGLSYASPTVGMFLHAPDYIKFLHNLRYYVSLTPEFITYEQSKYAYEDAFPSPIPNPIARLDDIELYCMHYTSAEEVTKRWQRRKERIDYDNLLIKFSERSLLCTPDLVRQFDAIPFPNKICFTMNSYNLASCVYVPKLIDIEILGGDETPCTLEHVNITHILNNLIPFRQ